MERGGLIGGDGLVLEAVGRQPQVHVCVRVVREPPLEELSLILQEPAAQLLGAAVGETQDKVRVVVLAQAGLAERHVLVARLADRLVQQFALEALCTGHVDCAEDWQRENQE